jgi:hypothetical protein
MSVRQVAIHTRTADATGVGQRRDDNPKRRPGDRSGNLHLRRGRKLDFDRPTAGPRPDQAPVLIPGLPLARSPLAGWLLLVWMNHRRHRSSDEREMQYLAPNYKP